MTISVNRSAPTAVRSATQSESVAPAAPQSQPQASTGYSAASSYASASTGTQTGSAADTKKAIEILGKTPGGEKLKKLLSENYMTSSEVSEAIEEFEKIGGKLSEGDRAIVEQSVRFESALSGCINMNKMIMDRLLAQLKENNKMPQW
jgi:predicted Zn-dependent protease